MLMVRWGIDPPFLAYYFKGFQRRFRSEWSRQSPCSCCWRYSSGLCVQRMKCRPRYDGSQRQGQYRWKRRGCSDLVLCQSNRMHRQSSGLPCSDLSLASRRLFLAASYHSRWTCAPRTYLGVRSWSQTSCRPTWSSRSQRTFVPRFGDHGCWQAHLEGCFRVQQTASDLCMTHQGFSVASWQSDPLVATRSAVCSWTAIMDCFIDRRMVSVVPFASSECFDRHHIAHSETEIFSLHLFEVVAYHLGMDHYNHNLAALYCRSEYAILVDCLHNSVAGPLPRTWGSVQQLLHHILLIFSHLTAHPTAARILAASSPFHPPGSPGPLDPRTVPTHHTCMEGISASGFYHPATMAYMKEIADYFGFINRHFSITWCSRWISFDWKNLDVYWSHSSVPVEEVRYLGGHRTYCWSFALSLSFESFTGLTRAFRLADCLHLVVKNRLNIDSCLGEAFGLGVVCFYGNPLFYLLVYLAVWMIYPYFASDQSTETFLLNYRDLSCFNPYSTDQFDHSVSYLRSFYQKYLDSLDLSKALDPLYFPEMSPCQMAYIHCLYQAFWTVTSFSPRSNYYYHQLTMMHHRLVVAYCSFIATDTAAAANRHRRCIFYLWMDWDHTFCTSICSGAS